MISQAQTILDNARDIYLEEGIQGLSMRKVAARVGVTATALYRHFDSKEELLAQVIDEGLKMFADYLHRCLRGDSPEERFLLSGVAYLDFALEQPKYYEILFMLPDELWRKNPPEGGHTTGSTFHFVADRVRECMDSGFLRKDDPLETALAIWSVCHGLISLYLTDRLQATPEEFRDMYNATHARVLQGLRP